MTKLVLNESIKKVIHGLDDHDIQQTIIARNWISHKDLITLYKSSLAAREDDLFSMLRNSEVYIQPPEPVAEKSPEYIARMKKLKQNLEEEEYQKMIASSFVPTYDANQNVAETPAAMTKELNHQLTTIVNIAVSVASVAYAIWYWSGSSMHLNNAYRVLLCLFFSILVLVAEVVVFNGYLTRIDDARTRERKKKEVKKVIGTIVFDSRLKKD